MRILEYIQAHASVQDDNGVIHNANIIWGTSEKPQLGNAIAKAAVQRPPEQVMLGAKSTRYSNIELLLSKPAYQSRNSKFVVQMPGGRKEVLKEENDAGQQAQQDAQGGSLFD